METDEPASAEARGQLWSTAVGVLAGRYRVERGTAWTMLWDWSRWCSVPVDDLARLIVADTQQRRPRR
jgi:hypothetical protein